MRALSSRLVNVLDEDPELCASLGAERLRLARSQAHATVIEPDRGEWDAERWPARVRRGLGLLVLDGLLIRRVGLDGRYGSELLSSGDLLRPWQREDGFTSVRSSSGWRVMQRCRIAVLDLDFAARIAPYPEIQGELLARGIRRCRNLTFNIAVLQRTRVAERLSLLLWSFADRWGRVRADGVFVQMSLTHSTLAELLAARRPTVTAALNRLERSGAITRVDGGVLLNGPPPVELRGLAGSVRHLPVSRGS